MVRRYFWRLQFLVILALLLAAGCNGEGANTSGDRESDQPTIEKTNIEPVTETTNVPETIGGAPASQYNPEDGEDTEPSGPSPAPSGGAPSGKYLCYQVPLYEFFGYLTLAENGEYDHRYSPEASPVAVGTYEYDLSLNAVVFLSGTFKDYGWIGVYLPAGSRSGTGGDRETVVLKEESDPTPPGEEADNEFIYCYLEE